MGKIIDEWANIQEDMLNEITERFHSYDDYLQLRLVCKQWNLKIPKIPSGNKVPWLLSPIAIDASETRDLEEKGIYHLMLPDMLEDNVIVGSCHGWLISVVVNEGTVQILNPFTKVHLDVVLPSVSTLPNVIGNDESQYILSDFHRPLDHSFVHRFLVHKVIINSAPNHDKKDLTAVALYGCAFRLAFYKPNDDRRWIKFSTDHDAFIDVIFFEEKIYAVDMYGQLYEFDSKTKSEPMEGIHEAPPPSEVATHYRHVKYLVGCAHNGSLLMVVRQYDELENEERAGWETYQFDIYQLKKNTKA
ncbi:hypothetical protein PIB30_099357, partial [Stylosanthes scabra]|nr:hypothetical protein [Stylosanthes scabra]